MPPETDAMTPIHEAVVAEPATTDDVPAGDTPALPPAGGWPDDWREKMAEGDQRFLDTLKRYASPTALRDAFKEQRRLISSGQLRKPLPENATAEQLAA